MNYSDYYATLCRMETRIEGKLRMLFTEIRETEIELDLIRDQRKEIQAELGAKIKEDGADE